MISIGIRTLSFAYARHQRQTRPAPDVAADARGLPTGDVRLRHIDSGEEIIRHAIDAAGMLESGAYEVVE
jgi:hypothetical protein